MLETPAEEPNGNTKHSENSTGIEIETGRKSICHILLPCTLDARGEHRTLLNSNCIIQQKYTENNNKRVAN
jgi:hypothetical protein